MKLKGIISLIVIFSAFLSGCVTDSQPLNPFPRDRNPDYAPSRIFPTREAFNHYYSFFRLDTNGNNLVELNEFITLRSNIPLPDSAEIFAREEFLRYDLNMDNSWDHFEHQAWLDNEYY